MCAPTSLSKSGISAASTKAPIDVVLQPPSLLSRYACATFMTAVFGVWGKIAFYGHSEDGSYDESKAPGVGAEIHSWKVPLTLTASYLLGLPVLRMFTTKYLTPSVDVKLLLKETMVVYNSGQVLLNGWMVYRFLDAVINRGHPFIGDLYTVNAGATFGVWIHYMDKYLEFFDTIFMVLRGRMDQVRETKTKELLTMRRRKKHFQQELEILNISTAVKRRPNYCFFACMELFLILRCYDMIAISTNYNSFWSHLTILVLFSNEYEYDANSRFPFFIFITMFP